MAEEPEETLIGRIAVAFNMITLDQLNDATDEQARQGNRRLGAILVENGFITLDQLAQVLQAQREYSGQRKATKPERPRAAATEPAAATERAPPPRRTSVSFGRPAATSRPTATPAPPPAETPPPTLSSTQSGAVLRPEVTSAQPITRSGQTPVAREAPAPPARQPAVAPAPAAAPPEPDDELAVTVHELSRSIPIAPRVRGPNDAALVERLEQILRRAASMGASDVLVHSRAIKMRRFGALTDLGERLTAGEVEQLLLAALDDDQHAGLQMTGELDFAYSVHGVARFRANVYRTLDGLNGVFHCIPDHPPTLQELGLPSSIAKLVNFHQGMILVTGPAGSGKTSTLAALINILNKERRDHILTIEDPVEYIHTSDRCIVNQRQVNRHTKSFANALRAALREDPDVICIGELRDLETISLALSAAETGHLVLATLHTNSSIRTVNRIVGSFPPSQQGQVRTMLSESLRAIIAQRLIPSADGNGVALAYELLYITRAAANLIRDNRTFQLTSVLQTGRMHGMRSLDDSLVELVSEGRITKQAAMAATENKKLFGGENA